MDTPPGRPLDSSFLKRLARAVEYHREALIRIAACHGPEGWAEDIVQDALEKAASGDVRPRGRLATRSRIVKWFGRVICNEARNRRRYEQRRECEPLEAALEIAQASPEASDPLLESLVVAAVDELPTKQREVAALRLLGFTLKEIAGITNGSLGAVKRHWHRAKQRLEPGLRRFL